MAWLELARSQASERRFELADRAYRSAFAAESTNAQILWDQASMWDRANQPRRARALYDQLAHGRWQDRFQSLQQRAQRLLESRPEP